jgi:hypothetical protein
MMAVYLISYDILDKNKGDEDPVLNKLNAMKATRCLYSEWLYESAKTAKEIADDIAAVLEDGDRLLVVPLRGPACRTVLLNDAASVALLNKAGL